LVRGRGQERIGLRRTSEPKGRRCRIRGEVLGPRAAVMERKAIDRVGKEEDRSWMRKDL